ncbi:MAG TPA: PD-(D/E)XK nuclease family protein [Patescibacteria group bacterium]|nr:PD-(D/E)XK nuclease family protein [Patescibacteria group bacterium]
MSDEFRLSATSIQDWEECKRRFYLAYVLNLQKTEDKTSFRVGKIWHGCHEIASMIPQSRCKLCYRRGELVESCYLCGGTGVLPEDLMDSVTRYVNHMYAKSPSDMTHDELEVERIKVLYSFVGYRWYFSEQRFDTVSSEIWFDNQIVDPSTRRFLRGFNVVGKVDHLLRDLSTGLLYIGERKSTRQSLDNSSYWNRLQLDVQVTTYLYELRISQMLGKLRKFGISENDPMIHGIWYDVWHVPTTDPKLLTQADTKEFLSTHTYFGEDFEVVQTTDSTGDAKVVVNDSTAPVTAGKKGFAIRETPEMYGARLMNDISQQPQFYFEQREIPRSDSQLIEYEDMLCKIAKGVNLFNKNDLWTPNCRSCESPFYCEFRNLCMNNVRVGPSDAVPMGYRKKPQRPSRKKG